MSCFVVLKTDSKYTVIANIQGGLKHWKLLLPFSTLLKISIWSQCVNPLLALLQSMHLETS